MDHVSAVTLQSKDPPAEGAIGVGQSGERSKWRKASPINTLELYILYLNKTFTHAYLLGPKFRSADMPIVSLISILSLYQDESSLIKPP